MSIPNPYASAGVVIPTTTTTTCIPNYVSITLQQGNSFVLPPGATLVAVSDKDNVQSDCIDLNTLEEYSCYIFYYNVRDEDDGTPEDPQEVVETLGVVIDGLFYEFNTPIVDNGEGGSTTSTILLNGFNNGLASVSLDSVIINTTVTTITNDNSNARFFCFKTLPSIASKMQIKIKDNTGDIINPIYLLPLYTWAQLDSSDIDVSQLEDSCSCSPSYTTTTTIP
jgi:hypothetical protein